MAPILSQVRIEGDPNSVDSFAACVTAVSRAVSGHGEYWYVEALTGTSFSPCVNGDENCIGWMVDGGNSERYRFIGKSLGLSITRVQMNDSVPKGWIGEYKTSGTIPEQAQGYFASMRYAIENGGYVIIATWPAWSVLVGWETSLAKLPFSTTPGFEGAVTRIWPPINARTFFSLKKTIKPDDQKEIIKETIRFGHDIASGQFLTGNIAFGGALYDKVVEIANGQYLCPGCSEHGCFGRMVKRINNGHAVTEQYLSYVQEQIGNSRNAELLGAATRSYSELEALSAKYLDWPSFTDRYDEAAFRKQIVADFTRMKEWHVEGSKALESLYMAM